MTPMQVQETLEADWIRLAQQGDRRAYAELVKVHQQGVINMVYRMCSDTQMAEDVAQDTFIRAWQHLPAYQPRSSFRNWLYRIASNRALDIFRRERETADIDDLPIPSGNPGPESEAIRSERGQAVQRAVLALPAASRSVLVLREYEGLSYKEISQMLDIPLGTVMSRLNYARSKLAEMLQEYLEAA